MPLSGGVQTLSNSQPKIPPPSRRQSERFSELARVAMLSQTATANSSTNSSTPSSPPPEPFLGPPAVTSAGDGAARIDSGSKSLKPLAKTLYGRVQEEHLHHHHIANGVPRSLGGALTDTPLPSTPGSPYITGKIGGSGISTPKIRATTLDIPGLTRSKVSPDGRISERDVGAKLVILMVGLPARGKSYIVKKIARYLNWAQHPTRIFNVGDRRRVATGKGKTISQVPTDHALRESVRRMSLHTSHPNGIISTDQLVGPPLVAQTAKILLNGEQQSPGELQPISPIDMRGSASQTHKTDNPILLPPPKQLEQDQSFFDPDNSEAKRIREQVAHETLDDLLQYVLGGGGSVGILDATNHTRERRMSLIKHLRDRDPTINVLFLESKCQDKNLLQANMRLKLSGPDYRGKDPVKSLRDFQQRVEQYEKKYEPLGDYEEEHDIPYCSMIDVGRKMVTHRVNGFLSIQTITYLMNFNLAPRQIWLTRHGESEDNVAGKIGGDSHLSATGHKYAKALERFIVEQRAAWEQLQIEKRATTHFPPRPGDATPPNPETAAGAQEVKNFCVWTSMLDRSIETGQYFCEEEFDIKQMRMLDELNAGIMEGMTYTEIRTKFQNEYQLRKKDKLAYRYPGPGGEGYLDVINRLRKVILEIERMQDHVLIIGHRSITRVLLAYFMGLKQEDISDLDVPLGVVYMLEPRPYGVEFKAYRWNPLTDEFTWEEDYKLRRVNEI